MTAVHHLAFSVLLPALIFPAASGNSLLRVVLHALIVLIEAGVLVWVCRTIAQTFEDLSVTEVELRARLERTQALEQEAALDHSRNEDRRRAAMVEIAVGFERAGRQHHRLRQRLGVPASGHGERHDRHGTADREPFGHVSSAAEAAASNVGTVAAAAEELGASVQEIGRQAQGSASLAQARGPRGRRDLGPGSGGSSRPLPGSATWSG